MQPDIVCYVASKRWSPMETFVDHRVTRCGSIAVRSEITSYDGGPPPSWRCAILGGELLKEAAVAINQFVEPGKRVDTLKLLPLSRDQLAIWAVRGRNIAAYTSAKAKYCLS
jgi:hypothetical protein